MKIIRDPVHGDIMLTPEEMRLVDTREFQRLRGIRQLGTSYLVFPGAQHTRFEHSLGTCWLAKKKAEVVNQRARRARIAEPIDQDETRFLGFAALLHDITHIPFGHTFEDERRILPPHDKNQERLYFFTHQGELADVLEDLGVRERLYHFFLNGKERDPQFTYQAVAGPISADLLDYLARDAYYCGLHMAYDDRIFRYLDVEGGRLYFNLYTDRGFRQDAWSELIHLLRIRYHLTERVYYHHTKMVSGAMLSRLLEALIEAGGIEIAELYGLRDDAFIHLLERRIGKIRHYTPLLSAFLSRHLYKRVYMVAKDPLNLDFPSAEAMTRFQNEFHENQQQARSALEQQLARQLGIPASAIIIYAPETQMRLKEANVLARVDSGPLVKLSDVQHPELEALRNRHQALWKFFLFMHPKYEHRFPKAAQLMEQTIGLPNQLELLNKGQLTLGF